MDRLDPRVLLVPLALLLGCAPLPPAVTGPSPPTASLLAGDIVVGVETLDSREAGAGRIVRYRRVGDAAQARIEGRTLITTDGVPLSVGLTADGAWLAATLQAAGQVATSLWRVREDGRTDPVWQSPPGCASPAFDPEAAFLALACPPQGRQPASILRLTLPSLEPLALIGELPRGAPVVGVEGDLYWVERVAGESVVLRRGTDAIPFPIHRLVDVVEALFPRWDGALMATVRNPNGGLELHELLPNGRVQPRSLPPELGVGSPVRLVANSEGDLLALRCPRGDCAIVEVSADGLAHAPLTISGRPTALAYVPHLARRVQRPEDLATAPVSALRTHSADALAVLGVRLGMPLETAYSLLDRAGLNPWWAAPPGPRTRPRSIGLGRASGSWCVEYLADERGLIAAMDLRDCAAPYLSSVVRPLFDGRNLGAEPLRTVERFLGPGVSVEVGDGAGSPGETRTHPTRRTTLQFDAPERGYHYRSETEVMESSPWMGRVWLRLQGPGKRQAVRP